MLEFKEGGCAIPDKQVVSKHLWLFPLPSFIPKLIQQCYGCSQPLLQYMLYHHVPGSIAIAVVLLHNVAYHQWSANVHSID